MTRSDRSVIAALRALVEARPHSMTEARAVVDEQASLLRRLRHPSAGATTDVRFPEIGIAGLEPIRVVAVDEPEFVVSALAHWHEGSWYIALDANEPETRRRYSLAYEFFHIVNHPTSQWLLPRAGGSHLRRREDLANHFAACLLMPEADVARLHRQGRGLRSMARAFDVSTRAMAARLTELGLNAPDEAADREAAA